MKYDPIWKTKYFLKLSDMTGKKKVLFWRSVTFLKIVIMCAETTYACKNLKHPKKLVILIATYPIRIMAIWKLIHLYFDKKRVENLFSNVSKDFWDFHIAGPTLEKKVRRRFFLTNLFVLFHVSLCTICVTFFVFYNMTQMPTGKRRLPNLIWTPFDTDPSPLHEILFLLLLWNLYLSIYGNLFYDMLFVYCVQHLYIQFMLLKELLKNISQDIMDDESDVEKFNSDYFQKKVMERLKICANHHSKLLRYGKNIEDFCKSVLAPQLIMSFAILVINGYNLTAEHNDISKTLMLINLTGSSFVQLAVYALQATDLRDQSLSILDSVIECKWYLFRSPLKRALVFMLMNAEKGIAINAAGMATVDNPLLVDIIQKAFSSVTLLQAFINEDTQK
nr:odorant receptor [Semanotus bifasciatus]